jgi:hypothetical protein
MKLEIINNIRVITPDADMWLCNETDKVISDKVYLGVGADENDWHDITETEKAEFETLWSEETPTEEEATEADYKAQAYDILMGVTE